MVLKPCEKLERLRALMVEHGVDGYVVPSEDSHQSEYPLEHDLRRQYISGFSGSAGFALVTPTKAFLYTDGRYFLQAEKQLDSSCWELCRQGTPDCPTLIDLVTRENITALGFDPFVHSQKWVETLTSDAFKLVPIYKASNKTDEATRCVKSPKDVQLGQKNLVDIVWDQDEAEHPAYPTNKIVGMPETLSGESHESKLKRVWEVMSKQGANVLVLANLSQIAWLTNTRGADVEFSRIFLAYAIVKKDAPLVVYIKRQDAADRVPKAHMEANNITVKCYDQDFLADVSKTAEGHDGKVWLDVDVNIGVTYIVKAALGDAVDSRLKVEKSPLGLMKAIKNEVEILGMQNAHFKDGMALSMWLAWMDSLDIATRAELTEVTGPDMLEKFRRAQPEFSCLSFPTIAGVNGNGAIIHYRPYAETCKKIDPSGMLLVDSGAHYETGTTDVTRTMHFGKPTDLQREMYTRVLQGHLDIASAVFPEGTYGCQLDVLARRNLWAIGFDYLHGTGHGVGHSLEVHEAPPNIAKMCPPSVRDVPFQSGMIVSNEPGAYIDGQFGIRIESLVHCREIAGQFKFNNVKYMGFDDLTLVPYDRRLIKKELLTPAQIKQINAYHERVFNAFGNLASIDAFVPKDCNLTTEMFQTWLKHACAPL